jgi:hypothetical protein
MYVLLYHYVVLESIIYTHGLLPRIILIGWWWYVPSYCGKLQYAQWLADGLSQS